jgi:hypothetical protein
MIAANSMTIVVAAAGLLVGILGAVLAAVAMSRARRMVATTAKRIRSELIASGPLDPRAVRDVAVVRYDALEEMAGQLSFSVAMLNSHGDGVVFTSINGRTETRTYAKVVADGQGVHQLSPEEQQAVRSAQLGHGPPTLLTQAPRAVGGHGPVRPATAADAERARTATQRPYDPAAEPSAGRPEGAGAPEPEGWRAAAWGAEKPDGWPSAASGAGESDGRRSGATRPGAADGKGPAATSAGAADGKGPGATGAGESDGKGPGGTGAGDSDGRRGAAQRAAEPQHKEAAGGHRTGSGDGAKLAGTDGSASRGAAGKPQPTADKSGPDNGDTPGGRGGDSGGAAGRPAPVPAGRRMPRGA